MPHTCPSTSMCVLYSKTISKNYYLHLLHGSVWDSAAATWSFC